jgi:pSer/pThr/pTyr-binding forkhead associated (FHA) protein
VVAEFSLSAGPNRQPGYAAKPLLTRLFYVEGSSMYSLSEPVTNIGRLPENHLVISDVRVSRRHAQIRLARTQYMIFDLDSRGGTFVNGRRITQSTLQPGDVISLAGVPLVFGVDMADNPYKPKKWLLQE